MTAQTWEISDLDGSNKRRVTLAQFLAERKEKAKIAEAIYRAKAKRNGRRHSRNVDSRDNR